MYQSRTKGVPGRTKMGRIGGEDNGQDGSQAPPHPPLQGVTVSHWLVPLIFLRFQGLTSPSQGCHRASHSDSCPRLPRTNTGSGWPACRAVAAAAKAGVLGPSDEDKRRTTCHRCKALNSNKLLSRRTASRKVGQKPAIGCRLSEVKGTKANGKSFAPTSSLSLCLPHCRNG